MNECRKLNAHIFWQALFFKEGIGEEKVQILEMDQIIKWATGMVSIFSTQIICNFEQNETNIGDHAVILYLFQTNFGLEKCLYELREDWSDQSYSKRWEDGW